MFKKIYEVRIGEIEFCFESYSIAERIFDQCNEAIKKHNQTNILLETNNFTQEEIEKLDLVLVLKILAREVYKNNDLAILEKKYLVNENNT